ncbi:MAG: hypothetical protein CFE27_11830 [Alphaproteobacteria bacterium PA1]|nr:MAG: hypothetical protein CFE27_11830 [Alphaproteobacteria bacterium PA1]
MALEILIPPEGEPVSLSDVRAYLRIGTQGDDALLALFITAAREAFEARTGRALLTRRVRQNFLGVLSPGFLIPATNPVTAIHAVRTILPSGALADPSGNILSLIDGKFVLNQPMRDFSVEYQAGYATSALVPQADRLAILEAVADAIARRDGDGSAPAAGERASWDQSFERVKL